MPTPKPKRSTAGALAAVPSATPSEPADVVVAFLDAFARSDLDAALDLVADDLAYTNVSLPTVHGKDRLELLARPVMRPDRVVFRAYLHHVAVDGDVVLTDRVDELKFRRFASRFWVYGRFVVRDGKIVVWRDSFDWLDVTIGNLRGLLGLVAPALNRRMPGD
jgi:limonene-1,2-epoxide hydrolase